MKRSFAVQVIMDRLSMLGIEYYQASDVLSDLEDLGVVSPTYLTPAEGSAMEIHEGWEDE
jgi:hypothetical protein